MGGGMKFLSPCLRNDDPLTRARAGIGQLANESWSIVPISEITKTEPGWVASIIAVAPTPCNRWYVPISSNALRCFARTCFSTAVAMLVSRHKDTIDFRTFLV